MKDDRWCKHLFKTLVRNQPNQTRFFESRLVAMHRIVFVVAFLSRKISLHFGCAFGGAVGWGEGWGWGGGVEVTRTHTTFGLTQTFCDTCFAVLRGSLTDRSVRLHRWRTNRASELKFPSSSSSSPSFQQKKKKKKKKKDAWE